MTKILIAEDNVLNSKLMFDILSSQGYEVDTVKDGKAAMNKISQNRYDLLLLDLLMPKLSGFEVMEKINENNIPIKTVVVSACAMSEEIERAKSLGCLDYITKPIRLNEFLTVISRNLD